MNIVASGKIARNFSFKATQLNVYTGLICKSPASSSLREGTFRAIELFRILTLASAFALDGPKCLNFLWVSRFSELSN